jgi:hypothetical protein
VTMRGRRAAPPHRCAPHRHVDDGHSAGAGIRARARPGRRRRPCRARRTARPAPGAPR